MNRIAFGITNIFSLPTRERCVANLKKLAVPQFGKPPSATGAVLVPLCRVDGVPALLYTVRAAAGGRGAGEVTFPGGVLQKHDSPAQRALTEAHSTIGLAPDKVCVWGCGPAVPARDNRLVVPVVGSVENIGAGDLNIKGKEILEVFTVPIELLCDPKNQYHTQFVNGFVTPVFMAEQYKIWGVTAFITHAFLNSALGRDVYRHDWMNKKVVIGRKRND